MIVGILIFGLIFAVVNVVFLGSRLSKLSISELFSVLVVIFGVIWWLAS